MVLRYSLRQGDGRSSVSKISNWDAPINLWEQALPACTMVVQTIANQGVVRRSPPPLGPARTLTVDLRWFISGPVRRTERVLSGLGLATEVASMAPASPASGAGLGCQACSPWVKRRPGAFDLILRGSVKLAENPVTRRFHTIVPTVTLFFSSKKGWPLKKGHPWRSNF